MTVSQFTRFARRTSIEKMVGQLVDFLKKYPGTNILIRVDGGIEDDKLRLIEQGVATVTGRHITLSCQEFDPMPGDNRRSWHVGIVDEQ